MPPQLPALGVRGLVWVHSRLLFRPGGLSLHFKLRENVPTASDGRHTVALFCADCTGGEKIGPRPSERGPDREWRKSQRSARILSDFQIKHLDSSDSTQR